LGKISVANEKEPAVVYLSSGENISFEMLMASSISYTIQIVFCIIFHTDLGDTDILTLYLKKKKKKKKEPQI
jgi:hypothetical protein